MAKVTVSLCKVRTSRFITIKEDKAPSGIWLWICSFVAPPFFPGPKDLVWFVLVANTQITVLQNEQGWVNGADTRDAVEQSMVMVPFVLTVSFNTDSNHCLNAK